MPSRFLRAPLALFLAASVLIVAAPSRRAAADNAYITHSMFGDFPTTVTGQNQVVANHHYGPFSYSGSWGPAYQDHIVRGSVTNDGSSFIRLYSQADVINDVGGNYIEAGWTDHIVLPASYAFQTLTLSFGLDGSSATHNSPGFTRIQAGNGFDDFGNLNPTYPFAEFSGPNTPNRPQGGTSSNWDSAVWIPYQDDASAANFYGTFHVSLFARPIFGGGEGGPNGFNLEGPGSPIGAVADFSMKVRITSTANGHLLPNFSTSSLITSDFEHTVQLLAFTDGFGAPVSGATFDSGLSVSAVPEASSFLAVGFVACVVGTCLAYCRVGVIPRNRIVRRWRATCPPTSKGP